MIDEILIQKFEGFSATPHWDYKQWSIGYGTNAAPGNTDPNNPPNITIDRQGAAAALRNSISGITDKINQYDSLYNFTDAQRTALTSFGYNLGAGAIDELTDNGTRSITEAIDSMLLYDNAGGSRLPGLSYRRALERYVANGGVIPEGVDINTFAAQIANSEENQNTLAALRSGNTSASYAGPGTEGAGSADDSPVVRANQAIETGQQLSLSDLAAIRDNYDWVDNTLNDFEFYTYNLEYFIIGQQDARNFFTNVPLSDISSGAWPPESVKKVVIAATGQTTEFNMDGLSIETTTGSSNAEVTSGASTRLSFTLTQVGEVSIADTLKAATSIGGWNNMSQAMMFVSIKFVGWANNESTILPNTTKVIPFRLSKVANITTEVSESGTTLIVEGMTIQRSAMSVQSDTLHHPLVVPKGNTVKDSLDNFQNALNQSIADNSIVADDKFNLTYKIAAIDETLAAEIINNNTVRYDGSNSGNSANNTVASTGAGASMKTAQETYTLPTGTSIYDSIKEILVQSETVKANLTTPNNSFTRVPIIRVEYVPKVGGYNVLTNTEGAEVTYHIDIVEEMIDQNSIDLGTKALNSSGILDVLTKTNRLKKKYENTYTGMNTDVIMFNVSLDQQLVKAFSSSQDQYFDVTSLVDQQVALEGLTAAKAAREAELGDELLRTAPQLESATRDRDSLRQSLARSRQGVVTSVSNELTAAGVDEDTASQIASLGIEEIMSIASGAGVSTGEGEDLGNLSVIRDVLGRMQDNRILDNFYDTIGSKIANLNRVNDNVKQLKSVLNSATAERNNILQTAIGSELSKQHNETRANINSNFAALNIGDSSVVLVEELGSDIRTQLTSSDAERMLFAITENPVQFTQVSETAMRGDNELRGIRGPDVNDTDLARMKYNEGHQANISMIKASMTIKGDPYWIESYSSPRTRAEVYGRDSNFTASLPNDSARNAGRNLVMVVENTLDDVDANDNQIISNLFTWIYLVKGVVSTFADGVFTQELDMMKFQYLDGMDTESNEAEGVVEEEERNTGPVRQLTAADFQRMGTAGIAQGTVDAIRSGTLTGDIGNAIDAVNSLEGNGLGLSGLEGTGGNVFAVSGSGRDIDPRLVAQNAYGSIAGSISTLAKKIADSSIPSAQDSARYASLIADAGMAAAYGSTEASEGIKAANRIISESFGSPEEVSQVLQELADGGDNVSPETIAMLKNVYEDPDSIVTPTQINDEAVFEVMTEIQTLSEQNSHSAEQIAEDVSAHMTPSLDATTTYDAPPSMMTLQNSNMMIDDTLPLLSMETYTAPTVPVVDYSSPQLEALDLPEEVINGYVEVAESRNGIKVRNYIDSLPPEQAAALNSIDSPYTVVTQPATRPEVTEPLKTPREAIMQSRIEDAQTQMISAAGGSYNDLSERDKEYYSELSDAYDEIDEIAELDPIRHEARLKVINDELDKSVRVYNDRLAGDDTSSNSTNEELVDNIAALDADYLSPPATGVYVDGDGATQITTNAKGNQVLPTQPSDDFKLPIDILKSDESLLVTDAHRAQYEEAENKWHDSRRSIRDVEVTIVDPMFGNFTGYLPAEWENPELAESLGLDTSPVTAGELISIDDPRYGQTSVGSLTEVMNRITMDYPLVTTVDLFNENNADGEGTGPLQLDIGAARFVLVDEEE